MGNRVCRQIWNWISISFRFSNTKIANCTENTFIRCHTACVHFLSFCLFCELNSFIFLFIFSLSLSFSLCLFFLFTFRCSRHSANANKPYTILTHRQCDLLIRNILLPVWLFFLSQKKNIVIKI